MNLTSILMVSGLFLSVPWYDLVAEEEVPSNDPFLITVNTPHRARLIDNDVEALYNFIEVINHAQKTIVIQAFVFNPDRSGRLVLQALTKKADAGVKVRILVDYYSNRLKTGLDGFYHDALQQHGIQMRYFNAASMLAFWKVGFRNHRKLLVVDDDEMVTGGRNIADEYFGMAERINYLDRDVWLEGPIAREAARQFELYWQSPIVSTPSAPSPPVFNRSLQASSSKSPKTKAQDAADFKARLAIYTATVTEARNSLSQKPEDVELKNKITRLGESELAQSPIVEVRSVTLVSDQPIPGDISRVVTPYLFKRLAAARHSLLIENFLFMCKDESKELFLTLLSRKVQIDLLTNSFGSDPNFVMAELANSRQNMAVRQGMNVFCYSGPPASDRIFCGSKAIWGLHTKCIVIDGRDSVIGSYNFDPRSACINAEGAIIINDSPEFAALLEGKIRNRIKNSTRMNADGSYADGSHCRSAGRILTIIMRPLLELFTDLL